MPVEELQLELVPRELLLPLQPVVAAFATFVDVESAEECVALVQELDEGLHSKPEKSRSETKNNNPRITWAPLRPGAPGLGILLGETWPGDRDPIE